MSEAVYEALQPVRGCATDEQWREITARIESMVAERDECIADLEWKTRGLAMALSQITDHFAAVMSGPLIAGKGVVFLNGVEGIPTIKAAREAMANLK